MFGHGQLDNFQPDTVCGSVRSRLLAGVALVDVGHLDALAGRRLSRLDALAGRRLSRLGQRRDLGAVLFVGGVTTSANRWPRVSTAAWTLDPLRRLCPS